MKCPQIAALWAASWAGRERERLLLPDELAV
jgi:hypothetical protein